MSIPVCSGLLTLMSINAYYLPSNPGGMRPKYGS